MNYDPNNPQPLAYHYTNETQDIYEKISHYESYVEKLKVIVSDYPDAKTGFEFGGYYYSKNANDKVNKFKFTTSVSGVRVFVWPYLETDKYIIHSSPKSFLIGLDLDFSPGSNKIVRLMDGWKELMQSWKINNNLIEEIETNCKQGISL
jgi:hypothetical protein